MSDTCRLFPLFGDPWPSCLLPSQFSDLYHCQKKFLVQQPIYTHRKIIKAPLLHQSLGPHVCLSFSLSLSLSPSLWLSLFHFLIVDSRPPGSGPLKNPNNWSLILFELIHSIPNIRRLFKY